MKSACLCSLALSIALMAGVPLSGALAATGNTVSDQQAGGDLVAAQSSSLMAAQGEGDESSASDAIDMHRLYNPNSGEHFYTADTTERDSLVKEGWNFEGIGWIAPTTSTEPVYRLYNANGGEHHYTTSKIERDWLVGLGWSNEGIGWYSADSSTTRTSLYRDYNPNAFANNHNYSASYTEHQNLVDVGWNFEGPAWYGLATIDSATQGWVWSGASLRYYKAGTPLKGQWVVTADPPSIAGDATGLRRYWIDGNGDVAASRLVDPSNAKDVAAGYLALATDHGYVVCGKYDDLAGHVYIADADGKLYDGLGWVVTAAIDGHLERYYFDASVHAARSGSFSVDGAQYWGEAGQGYVARNKRLQVDGAWKWANNDGVLSADPIVPALIAKAQGYYSPSRYLIMVDIDDPCTVVFEGSQGAWAIKYVMECSTGAPSTPTVEGVYSIGLKGYSFGEEKGYSCYYWTQFYGDYLFHTRKYYANTRTLMDDRLNQRISEGCVRLLDEDAIWIQDNVPVGTTVVTTY